MTTSVSSKGQIVLPAELRLRDGIKPGQKFRVERLEAGTYRLVRQKRAKSRGLVDWLQACPVKGYFVPIPSESTSTM